MKIRYALSAPLGPKPVSELSGGRNIAWFPGREIDLPDEDARRLLRSGGRAFETVVAAVAPAPKAKPKQSSAPAETEPKEVTE